jgi:hypothetical protein
VTLTNAWTDASNANDREVRSTNGAGIRALRLNGHLWTPRSEWLDNLLNHMEIKEPWTMRELAPKVYGDFAIVTAVGNVA